MQKLKEKLHNQRGFTLVEMLIVVAIIAILIAVSIPMMSSSLEKSRHAVDDANKRDAIGLANILILTENITTETTKYYHVDEESLQGTLVDDKSKAVVASCQCDSGQKGQILKVTIKPASGIDSSPTVKAEWADKD